MEHLKRFRVALESKSLVQTLQLGPRQAAGLQVTDRPRAAQPQRR